MMRNCRELWQSNSAAKFWSPGLTQSEKGKTRTDRMSAGWLRISTNLRFRRRSSRGGGRTTSRRRSSSMPEQPNPWCLDVEEREDTCSGLGSEYISAEAGGRTAGAGAAAEPRAAAEPGVGISLVLLGVSPVLVLVCFPSRPIRVLVSHLHMWDLFCGYH